MAGIFYGVGVGPGDPELLTLQAVRIIQESDVLCVPGKAPEKTAAYKIAAAGVPGIEKKKTVGIFMPMTKDEKALQKAHQEAEKIICTLLEENRKVSFLTLGDPCVYSTYLYLQKRVKSRGYKTAIISGIPSFLAVSAKLNEGLMEKDEMLHILPASYQIEEGLNLNGVKVLMKAGSKAGEVRDYLKAAGQRAKAVERCGMEGEKIYDSLDDIPDDLSYYSIMIVKDREEQA